MTDTPAAPTVPQDSVPQPGPLPGSGSDGSALEPVFSRFRLDPVPPTGTIAADPAPEGALAVIAPHIDRRFYLANLADDAAALRDPVAHYHTVGWKQGHWPNPDFDTRFYLRNNEDVRNAGIDPLLHYLRFGRAEGRLPQRPGGSRRALVEAATPPGSRRPGRHAPAAAPALDGPALAERLRAACLGKRGLVVALSHDRYMDSTGGMQIFIADEQAQFNADRIAYLHIAPILTRLAFAPEDGAPLPLQLTLDGVVLGIVLASEIVAAAATLDDATIAHRLLVVHSLFGHRCSDVSGLSRALRPARNIFWLHDYGTLCAGYNLLRNDVAFCGAPAETSMGCRICVYGEGRAAYRGTVAALFEAVSFDVLCPSEAAARIWRDGAGALPWRSLRVHPNALVRPAAIREAQPGPVRIAFIGYPIPAKGWMLFIELFRRARGRPEFVFYHFATPEALRPMPGLTGVPVRVDRHDRLAMARAVAAADIDFVAMLAPWPETFSYVTREAFAGGADVVALAQSGAVAEAVRELNRGVVLASAADVLRFFLDGHAAAYAMRQRAEGRQDGVFLACGTTASFDPISPVLDPARLATRDPALVVVAGNAVVAGTIAGERLVFDLPAGITGVRLLSRHVVPVRLDPEGGDMRRFGVPVVALELDGVAVPIGDNRRATGWHGAVPADGVQWTSGDGLLETGGARRLSLALADGVAYQRCKLVPEG